MSSFRVNGLCGHQGLLIDFRRPGAKLQNVAPYALGKQKGQRARESGVLKLGARLESLKTAQGIFKRG